MWKSIVSRLNEGGVRQNLERLLASTTVVSQLRLELDQARSRADLGADAPLTFARERTSVEYQRAYSAPQPLVTVCIATYNRGQLLEERSVRSVLGQTYRNLQLLVIGDHCTDDTQRRMARIRDTRLTFVNLTERGRYPEDPAQRWMVAGTEPANRALEMAEGAFITHLDDDDEHPAERTETLLEHIQRSRADLLWHPFRYQDRSYRWRMNSARHFRANEVTTSSVFYHRWFRSVPWDVTAFTYGEPGDWNRFRKLRYLGARTERNANCLLRHFRERSQRSP